MIAAGVLTVGASDDEDDERVEQGEMEAIAAIGRTAFVPSCLPFGVLRKKAR